MSAGLGPLPAEEALKRAYYYTEAGDWRGPDVDEWDRWHAVAKVAVAQVDAERERWLRIAEAAQAVTVGCDDQGEDFILPSHLMAALALALDDGPNVPHERGA